MRGLKIGCIAAALGFFLGRLALAGILMLTGGYEPLDSRLSLGLLCGSALVSVMPGQGHFEIKVLSGQANEARHLLAGVAARTKR